MTALASSAPYAARLNVDYPEQLNRLIFRPPQLEKP